MSAGSSDDDQPLHQAPWVFFATVGTCFGFLTLILFGKMMSSAGGDVPTVVFVIPTVLFVVSMGLAMWPKLHP